MDGFCEDETFFGIVCFNHIDAVSFSLFCEMADGNAVASVTADSELSRFQMTLD